MILLLALVQEEAKGRGHKTERELSIGMMREKENGGWRRRCRDSWVESQLALSSYIKF